MLPLLCATEFRFRLGKLDENSLKLQVNSNVN